MPIPVHSAALESGGEAFLTEAFRASGALSADNRITRITQFEDCLGGSTGRKLLLFIAYEKPAESRFDPRFRSHESARAQLHMLSLFLHLWQTRDFPDILARLLRRT